MDVPLLTKRVMYKPSVKEPGVPGVLVLTEKKFTFTPANPSSTLKLDVDFWAIKAIKVSGKGSKQALMNLIPGPAIKGGGFIFEFGNLEDREACKDLMGPLITQNQSTAASNNQVAQGAADSNIEQLKAGMEHRVRLLLEDSELQKLHKELVIGGVLTDAEFWATRKHLLQEKAFKSGKQRTALKSAMFDIKHMNDGHYNTVNFNLTGDLIQQIFTEKPAVHRAYLTMVPHKLDEKEFWNKYFKAEYLHRTKSAAAAKAEADDDEELALFMKDDEILLKDAQRKIRKVDPTVDMASDYADDYTHLPGHGIIRGPGSENIEVDGNKPKRTLIQDLNRHAEVVLEGQTLDSDLGDTRSVAEALAKVKQAEMAGGAIDNVSDEDRLNRLYEMTEMEDLQGPQTLPYAHLHIQDPRKYFNPEQDNSNQGPERAGSFGTGNCCVDEVYESFGNVLLENRRKELRDPIIKSDSALKVFNNLTQYISSTKSHLGKSPENDVLGSLPSKTKQELKEQWSTIQELLRHFWACYPITSTFLFDKANRLKNAMNQMYEKLERSKTSAQPEYRHQASMLIQPMLQALEAAFTHHEAESKKRSLKGTLKVNGVM